MGRFLTTLLLLVSTSVLGATQPDNGIYLSARGDPAAQIKCQDGRDLSLGARQELKIQKSEISSQNNANDRFYVQLTIPYDESLDAASYILIVSGTAYGRITRPDRQSGSGSSQKETSSLFFYISGDENAKQVAEFLKTPVVYRRHPQHNLRISFIPTKQEFSAGEEVTATLQITNVGTNSISFMKGGDNQYVFLARHKGKFIQVDDIGTSYHSGGKAGRRVLKPGDVFEDKISLSKWFAFDKAEMDERQGSYALDFSDQMYEIHGSYCLDFNDPEDQSWRTIWKDYVSADFWVRIKEQEKISLWRGQTSIVDSAEKPSAPVTR
jgi:hypothetical protein